MVVDAEPGETDRPTLPSRHSSVLLPRGGRLRLREPQSRIGNERHLVLRRLSPDDRDHCPRLFVSVSYGLWRASRTSRARASRT